MEPESRVIASEANNENGEDWQEQAYQRIMSMKEKYFADLNELYRKIIVKLEEFQTIYEGPRPDWLDKIYMYRTMVRGIILFLLTVNKSQITPTYVNRLDGYEDQIVKLLAIIKSPGPVRLAPVTKRVMAPRPIGAFYVP